jgi:glutaredoxin
MSESIKTIVWSKVTCPFCDMAKTLLKNKGIVFEERMIGVNWTREQLLESIPQARTVPQIILNGVLIGGYEQLKAHFNKGKNE